ncbi:hypothetical protein TNCV_4776311 [Trichonephila clavipes]|nr:hypothetical protein TNCV_4776311 [Trichonephila clavipes]
MLVDFSPQGTPISLDAYCASLRKLRRALQNKRHGVLSKGQRCTLNLSRAETSFRWRGVVVRRGSVNSGVVHVTCPWFKITWSVAKSPRVPKQCYVNIQSIGFQSSGRAAVAQWLGYRTMVEGENAFNDDHREEITNFVPSIPGFQECDEDVETWMACDAEDCGFQMLNDDEIVTSVQEESDPVDVETDEDEDNNESSKGSSNADVFSALETAMEWYEKQSECCPTQLLLLKRIRDLAAKKRT